MKISLNICLIFTYNFSDFTVILLEICYSNNFLSGSIFYTYLTVRLRLSMLEISTAFITPKQYHFIHD